MLTDTQRALKAQTARDGFRALIELVDSDSSRDGVQRTPDRAVNAFLEMTSGYQDNPASILSTVFDQKSDEMILIRDASFVSLCEHHLLPFFGTASIGYLPGLEGNVVGVSKLVRLLECYARRLQIQERLTLQIAEAIQDNLKPDGVAVVIIAKHQCMYCRGVKQATAELVTSAMLGSMRADSTARAEFLRLAGM